jgi:hypothetical protein
VNVGGKGGDRRCALGRPAAFGDELVDLVISANLPRGGDLGLPLLAQAGGLKGQPPIDQRLDAISVGKSEPDRGAKIGGGAGGLAHLAIGDAAEIKRFGRITLRGAVGVDRGRELPDGVVVFAGSESGGTPFEPRILSVSGAGSKYEHQASGDKT